MVELWEIWTVERRLPLRGRVGFSGVYEIVLDLVLVWKVPAGCGFKVMRCRGRYWGPWEVEPVMGWVEVFGGGLGGVVFPGLV